MTASLFGLGAGAVRAAASALFGALTSWVAAGAASLLKALGAVLDATSRPDLASGFSREFSVMLVVSAALALPIVLLAVVRAIVQQDLGELLRIFLLRLPVAIVLSAAAVELVSLALGAADEISAALLGAAGGPVDSMIGRLVAVLTITGGLTLGPAGAVSLGGFAAFFLALVAGVVAFLLWLELVVRSAAIGVATLFLPLALAGATWAPTAHWARRLGETIVALVLAKVVIAGTLALGGAVLVEGDGPGSFVEGVALILMAALAPFALLRMMPMVESGAVGHLEGLARRGARSMNHGVGAARDGLASHLERFDADASSGSSTSVVDSGIDWCPRNATPEDVARLEAVWRDAGLPSE